MDTRSSTKPEWFWPLAVASFVSACSLVFFTPAFNTNDDVLIQFMTSGTHLFPGAPSEYVIGANVLLGLVLKALYSWIPALPWYSISLEAGAFSALFFSLRLLQVRFEGRRTSDYFFVAAYLVVLTLPLFLSLQYTAISVWLAGSAALSAHDWALSGRRSRWAWLHGFGAVVASVLAFVFATALRTPSAQLGLLIAAPFFGFSLIQQSCNKKRAKLLGVGLILALVAVGLDFFHRHYFDRTAEYRNFVKTQVATGKMIDFNYVELITPEVAAKHGWTENDRALFSRWFGLDDPLYRAPVLSDIYAEVAPTRHFRWPDARDYLVNLLQSERAVFLFIALVWTGVGAGLPSGAAVLSCWLGLGALVVYAGFGRPPPWRVYYPVLALNGLLLIARVQAQLRDQKSRRFRTLLVACCAVAVGWTVISSVSRYRADSVMAKDRHREVLDQLRQLNPRSDQLYIAWGAAFPFEHYALPFRERELLNQFEIYWDAIPGRLPDADSMLKKRHILSLGHELATSDRVLLFASEGDLRYVKTYLKERFDLDTVTESVFSGSSFSVYRFRSEPGTKISRKSDD